MHAEGSYNSTSHTYPSASQIDIPAQKYNVKPIINKPSATNNTHKLPLSLEYWKEKKLVTPIPSHTPHTTGYED